VNVGVTPLPILPGGNKPPYPLDRKFGTTVGLYVAMKRKFLSPLQFELRFSGRPTRSYCSGLSGRCAFVILPVSVFRRDPPFFYGRGNS
jgi:hypothetical protein